MENGIMLRDFRLEEYLKWKKIGQLQNNVGLVMDFLKQVIHSSLRSAEHSKNYKSFQNKNVYKLKNVNEGSGKQSKKKPKSCQRSL